MKLLTDRKGPTAMLTSCSLLVMASLSPLAQAQTDSLIYDNGVIPNTGISSQLDVAYPFESQVADDFELISSGTILVTGVSFTGLQFGDPPDLPNPVDFNVYFYADDGTGTGPLYTGDGTSSPGVDALAIFTGVLTAPEPAPGPYSFGFDFTGSVALTGGVQYWISIQAATMFPPQYGWQGDNTNGGNATQGFPLLGTDFWTTLDPGSEMDFQLYGTAVPVPAAIWLLGSALAGIGFCGRKKTA